MTLREPDLPPVRLADQSLEMQLLVGARADVVTEMTRVRNRLHADLRVLVPGYGTSATSLTTVRLQRTVARLLARLSGSRPHSLADASGDSAPSRAEEHALDGQLGARVVGHPLLTLPGAGALVTATLVGEVGDVRRFRTADAVAALAGVAPIPASSGQTQRMRLDRGGNRQLNWALDTIALSQA